MECKEPVVGNDGQTRYKIACCLKEEECGKVTQGKNTYPICMKAICTCGDSSDLDNRRNEAIAAIQEYQRQQAVYANQNFSGDYRNVIQPAVQKAINAVTKQYANLVAGSTDPNSCTISVKNASSRPGKFMTPCLEDLVRSHEKVHKDACEKWKNNSLFKKWLPTADYRDEMSMYDVLQEEITGYNTELQEISKKLAKLPAGCK